MNSAEPRANAIMTAWQCEAPLWTTLGDAAKVIDGILSPRLPARLTRFGRRGLTEWSARGHVPPNAGDDLHGRAVRRDLSMTYGTENRGSQGSWTARRGA